MSPNEGVNQVSYGLAVLASEILIKPDPALVMLLSTLIIPLLVGLATKKYASKAAKALTNAAAVSVVATLSLAATSGLTAQALAVSVFVGFLTSSAAHEFIWKNLGVSEAIANIAPDKGIGLASHEPIDARYTASTLDVDTALTYLDDPDVATDDTFDANAPHGENPELISRKDER